MSATLINGRTPAFPRPASEYTKSGTLPDGNDAEKAQDGMTLREWYAGLALQGMVRRGPLDGEPESLAIDAARYADALLAELGKSPK